ncbi:FHA domain-containing protein [Adhaeretor mobilis]|uniref:FHA domain-containing protein FhaA n=1 Tax=Adhaeretor mobilis TaxID=1930276 RepID=A0A517MQZ4_9BACT|nr:FHA domain-containing protein [Adhaeretor mobilis]QDS97302.1 FHA domain-containing protein FhaA [Adhaeretor mobilis]
MTNGEITLRVLDGADRGDVYETLETPITIGREEGNTVQLHDERISRFHLKIQEDRDKLVLTDLESTNGTRVNGEDTHLRILRYGDVITLGRSVLLFGTRKQIASRLEELRGGLGDTNEITADEISAQAADSKSMSFAFRLGSSEDLQSTLHIPSPPDLPESLSPGQAAQVSELLEYLHLRARQLLQNAVVEENTGRVVIPLAYWQDLLEMQSQLAEYMRRIGEPGQK